MDNKKVGEDLEKLEPSKNSGGNLKWYSHFRKPSFPQNVENRVTLWSVQRLII
jgi:hypothetical protein